KRQQRPAGISHRSGVRRSHGLRQQLRHAAARQSRRRRQNFHRRHRRIDRKNRALGIVMTRLSFWVFALYVLFVLFCSPAAAQEKKNIRIVFVSLSWNNQLPIRVAIARGFFKDQGLALEPIFVRGGPVAITALISGNVDFASVGGAQAPIRSNARGLDLHIIASLSNYTNYTLLGSKDAKNVEDLRGKVIGVTGAGAFSDFAIRIYLKRNNLDPDKDATLRAIGPTALRAVALEKGLIAAAPFSAEDTIRLLDKGFPMIVNLNEALRIPQSVFVTRGEMLQKYPETTKRFLKAVILGMQFAKQNKLEAI